MKTKAVRLYGENDLRLEEFELPQLKDGEILIKIISDNSKVFMPASAKNITLHAAVKAHQTGKAGFLQNHKLLI